MRASKFVVCLFLYFLHMARGGAMYVDPELGQLGQRYGNGNGTNPSDFHYLVTGGYRPPVNDLVKYAVSLRVGEPRTYFGTNHMCGGSIITEKAILTAAHCLFTKRGLKLPASSLTVFAGTPKRLQQAPSTQEMKVRRIVPHPKYRPGRYRHDLGMVLLKEELSMNDHVAIIPLKDNEPAPGLSCTVTGWGTVVQFGPSPDEAINGDVEILPETECKKLKNFNPTGMICAKSAETSDVDSCQGDSGGPLICNNMLTGVVSFGDGCGEVYSAGVYTDVYYYREWIIENSANQVWLRSLVLVLAVLLAAW